jgi:hypothetical protein
MSLTLLAALAAAVAASVGYLSARRVKRPEDNLGDSGGQRRAPLGRSARGAAFRGLPLALGDVVLAGSEERWLSGAIAAREKGELIAVVFIAPEGVRERAVAVFPPPRRDIYWLSPVEIDSPDEPPATLEIQGVNMRRQGRKPAALERMGQGAPPVGMAGILALYDGGGSDVAVVIGSEGRIHAWAGRRIEEEGYERLGGGGTSD